MIRFQQHSPIITSGNDVVTKLVVTKCELGYDCTKAFTSKYTKKSFLLSLCVRELTLPRRWPRYTVPKA